MNYEGSLKNDMKRLAVIVILLMGCATLGVETPVNMTKELVAQTINDEHTTYNGRYWEYSWGIKYDVGFFSSLITTDGKAVKIEYLDVGHDVTAGLLYDRDGDGCVDYWKENGKKKTGGQEFYTAYFRYAMEAFKHGVWVPVKEKEK